MADETKKTGTDANPNPGDGEQQQVGQQQPQGEQQAQQAQQQQAAQEPSNEVVEGMDISDLLDLDDEGDAGEGQQAAPKDGKGTQAGDGKTADGTDGKPSDGSAVKEGDEGKQQQQAQKPADAGTQQAQQQTRDGASPLEPGAKSAVDILQEMGLLPAGYQPPDDGTGQQQTQQGQPVQTQVVPIDPNALQTAQPGTAVPVQVQQVPIQTQQQPAQVQQPQGQQPAQTSEELRNQQIANLAEHHYALDSETVEALKAEGNEELVKFAPQFAARIFVDAVQAVGQHVAQAIPAMIEHHNQQAERSKQYENAFFTFWDGRGFDLREHSNELAQIGMAYRNANPNSRPENLITHVGASLIMSKQIAPKDGTFVPGTVVASGGANGQQGNQQQQRPGFQSAGAAPGVTGQAPVRSEMEEFLHEVIEDADFA